MITARNAKKTENQTLELTAFAATPRNRELAALQRIANNQGAMEKLGKMASSSGPWIAIAAAVGTAAVALEKVTKSGEEAIEKLKQAGIEVGPEFEQSIHPLNTFFDSFKGIVQATLDMITGGALSGALAQLDQLKTAADFAGLMKQNLESAREWHAELEKDSAAMTLDTEREKENQIGNEIDNNIRLLKEKQKLESDRENRAGADVGTKALGDLTRTKEVQGEEEKKAEHDAAVAMGESIAAANKEKADKERLAEAERKYAEVLLRNQIAYQIDAENGLHSDSINAERKKREEEAQKERLAAQQAVAKDEHLSAVADTRSQKAGGNVDTLIEEDRLRITNAAEAGMAKLTDAAAKADADLAAKGIALIEQAKQKHAGQQSDMAAQLEAALQPIADHATGSAEENKRVTEIIRQFTQTSDAKDAEIIKGMWDLIKIGQDTRTKIASMQQAIKNLQDWQNDKINAPSF